MTIAMFFKSLTCRTPEIVAASKKGLTGVIAQQKLPKDLLQSSLRPILGPICAHHKHLSLPLLQGLARLLELLSSWFNVTLGEKLIDHLNKWLEPEKLAQVSRLGGLDVHWAIAVPCSVGSCTMTGQESGKVKWLNVHSISRC